MANKKEVRKRTREQKIQDNALIEIKNEGQALIMQDYLDNFDKYVKKRQKEFARALDKFIDKFEGNVPDNISTLEISRALTIPFVKPNVQSCISYTPEQLLMANDFYWDSVVKVLNSGIHYVPTIQDFASMLNISATTLIKTYAANAQEQMREAVQIIKDNFVSYYTQCGMKRELSEVMSIFTMKSSLGMRDNDPPITVINNTGVIADEQSVEAFRKRLLADNE